MYNRFGLDSLFCGVGVWVFRGLGWCGSGVGGAMRFTVAVYRWLTGLELLPKSMCLTKGVRGQNMLSDYRSTSLPTTE